MLYRFFRSVIFLLPPEFSHHFILKILKFVNFISLLKAKDIKNEKPVSIKGLNFKNKVGLAAGFDKNAEHIEIFENLGFGFLEIGTVTPKPQPGNKKPRIYRDPKNEALINSFGFNNVGIYKFIDNIKKSNVNLIIGINIGKNAMTAYEDSINDYIACMREAYIYADYLTVNISSPNTKNLRDLHNLSDLRIFIKSLMIEKNKLKKKLNKSVPIFLKLSPDIEESKIKPIIDLLIANSIDGVIISNTTIDKSKISKHYQHLPGGVSGAPLKIKSEQILSKVKKISKNKLLIISVGGIMTADDALKRIRLGADLVQIYTGLIYQGPSLVNEIRQKLS